MGVGECRLNMMVVYVGVGVWVGVSLSAGIHSMVCLQGVGSMYAHNKPVLSSVSVLDVPGFCIVAACVHMQSITTPCPATYRAACGATLCPIIIMVIHGKPHMGMLPHTKI